MRTEGMVRLMEKHPALSTTNILIQTLLNTKNLLNYLWKTVQNIRGRYNSRYTSRQPFSAIL